MKPRALDLFCGAGGASMGLYRAGFDVTGVDHKWQPRYPFSFRMANALSYPLVGFDFIWASPPCQDNIHGLKAVNAKLGRNPKYGDLIPATRARLLASGIPFVIENVIGSKLHFPIRLCGSSFGLLVRRHRHFESSWTLFARDCAHYLQTEKRFPTAFRPHKQGALSTVVQVYGKCKGVALWPEAMGIDWMKPPELSQAIPPAYSEFIGKQALRYIERRVG